MRRGFSLLEVVLALALMILLLGAAMTFLWELGDRRATLARGSRDLHAGAVLVERLEADLASGLAGDSGIGAGVEGTETRLKLLSRGVWLAPGTAQGGSANAGGEAEGDLQASEYSFDPSAGRVSARRFVVKASAGGSGQGKMELVTDRVERVRFRYYDGKEWRASFNSLSEGTLPVAIEVAVWFTALKNATAPPMTPATPGAASMTPEASMAGDAVERDASSAEAPSASADTDAETDRRWPAPDRLRVIIVPDGPVSTWKEGA